MILRFHYLMWFVLSFPAPVVKSFRINGMMTHNYFVACINGKSKSNGVSAPYLILIL